MCLSREQASLPSASQVLLCLGLDEQYQDLPLSLEHAQAKLEYDDSAQGFLIRLFTGVASPSQKFRSLMPSAGGCRFMQNAVLRVIRCPQHQPAPYHDKLAFEPEVDELDGEGGSDGSSEN